tara:strand:+ start:25792 stop:26049 length:258 start_codon:yes stop_codon:yes gene_type:complete
MLLADGLDEALIGVARRCGQPDLVAYSVSKCIEVFMRSGLSYLEACEHFEFNTAGAWVGEGTPVWVYDHEGWFEELKDEWQAKKP